MFNSHRTSGSRPWQQHSQHSNSGSLNWKAWHSRRGAVYAAYASDQNEVPGLRKLVLPNHATEPRIQPQKRLDNISAGNYHQRPDDRDTQERAEKCDATARHDTCKMPAKPAQPPNRLHGVVASPQAENLWHPLLELCSWVGGHGRVLTGLRLGAFEIPTADSEVRLQVEYRSRFIMARSCCTRLEPPSKGIGPHCRALLLRRGHLGRPIVYPLPKCPPEESKPIGHRNCKDSPPSHKHCTIKSATQSITLWRHNPCRLGVSSMERNDMSRSTSIAPEGSMNVIRIGDGLKNGCLVTPDGLISDPCARRVRCSPSYLFWCHSCGVGGLWGVVRNGKIFAHCTVHPLSK